MKRIIKQTTFFSKCLDNLLKKRKLLKDDFDQFQNELAEHPDMGDVVPGTHGIRKVRLKSPSGGKSGGFRVCYYDVTRINEILLILIYAKNEQENLTTEQKKSLKDTVMAIRRKLK